MVLRVNSFILKWWATSSADINLPQYTTNNSTFSCTLLLGSISSITSGTMGSMMLFKVSGIALNRMKNMREPWVVTFYCHTIYWRDCSHGDDYLTWHFKQILATLELTKINKRWPQKNYYISTVCTTVNFKQLWFNNESSCLHFCEWHSYVVGYEFVCVSLDKF